MTALSVENLSFNYGARKAIDGVTFHVESGRFCALLGPNGAGKSTLFSLLTGLLATRHGRIEIAGNDMSRTPRMALARMGVVFQQSTLDLDLTVTQNLRYFAALQGMSGADANTRIDAALTRLNMRERSGEKVRELNGGHRRRTEIARALLHKPEVMLLDEPTVGLDAASRRSLTDHVHDLCETDGISVLWATHLTDEVCLSDDLVVLHQGTVLANDLAGSIAGEHPLQDAFFSLVGESA